MNESTYHFLAWCMIALAAITFIALRFVVAPYGRHIREGWGPTVPERLGWMVMESPSSVGFLFVFLRGGHATEPARLALASLWLVHYVHRTFIYPLRLQSRNKRMPVVIVAMAFAFNVLNISINASWIAALGTYATSWLLDPRFLAGTFFFVVGFVINYDADRRLFGLRKAGSGYSIPRGGLFRFITCPNYFGELIEWFGWALASFSLGGLAFAIYSAANLVPRAIANDTWYRKTFSDYPPDRRILVPGLF